MGVASTSKLDSKSIKTVAEKAFKLAKSSSNYTKEKIVFPEVKACKKILKAKVQIHPKDIDTKEKLEFVLARFRASRHRRVHCQ